MASFTRPILRRKAAVTALGAIAGLTALTGLTVAAVPAASAASVALPAPGASLIQNGDFALPGPATHEGATPTDWKLVDLGTETKPFNAAIGAYDAKGQFPPPKGNPNKSDIADEVFYEAGSSLGIEGIGGQQTTFKVKSITQANNPEISFANVESKAPVISVARWAGNGLEVSLAHEGKSYTLVYLNLWTPATGTYTLKPANTPSTKYILGPTLKQGVWNTQAPRNLEADVKAQFGWKLFQITAVTFVDLEHTINAGTPFPNMDGYLANVAVTEGPAAK
jgi:hypothetical protein